VLLLDSTLANALLLHYTIGLAAAANDV